MRFDSAEFLFFFLPIVVLHHFLREKRLLLVVTSYLFYASWNPPFLLLLAASTFLDYFVGLQLDRTAAPGRRKVLLALSVSGNLGLLGYFKYVNFFLDNLSALGVSADVLTPFYVRAEIPLGISFYTFQTLSYAIDVYRRHIKACESPLDFALFVAFFPQLIAGPILRAAEFIPQIRRNAAADTRQTIEGLELCLVGLFKKVVIADAFAVLVDRVYAEPDAYSGGALLVATFAFSCQIYCDFSGYSTMAQGLAKLLGYELPRNFDFPLLAGNPVEYRRRWHITMGTWFRDYLYRPLGGDRRGLRRTVWNTLLTWTAFGFWHGANWTFLLWGLYNGILLAGYRVLKERNRLPTEGPGVALAGYVVMPLFLSLSNVFFRSGDISAAITILHRIATGAPGRIAIHSLWATSLLCLYVLHWVNRLWYREGLLCRVGWPGRLALIGGILMLLYIGAGAGEPFYYFRF